MLLRRTIKIGTRGSPLALVQTRLAANAIKKKYPFIGVKEIIIKTSGDKFKGDLAEFPVPRSTIKKTSHKYSGKGLFVKEIEEALILGKIDMAVHSLKDVPAVLGGGLKIAAYLKREDPRDIFLSARYRSLMDMPRGAVLGTSSPRRKAQALSIRPDLKIVPLRGNVGTRLAKLKSGECAATILAAAGLKRLGALYTLTHLRTLFHPSARELSPLKREAPTRN